MSAHSEFQRALAEGDVRLLRRIWRTVFPHLPEPKDAAEAEATMHVARTAAESVPLKARAYSHRWCEERGLPSQLPDKLKPSAERMYPKIVEAVGIACKTSKDWLKPAMPIIEKAMTDVVEDAFASGERDPGLIRDRIQFARTDTMKRLFGAPTAKEIER